MSSPSSTPDHQAPPSDGSSGAAAVAHPLVPWGGVPGLVVVQTDARATASFVLGLVATAVVWIPLVNAVSVVMGSLAVVLGAVVLRSARVGHPAAQGGRGLALAGVWCGAFSAAVVLVLTGLFAWWRWAVANGLATELT